jgi:hypothetical protein
MKSSRSRPRLTHALSLLAACGVGAILHGLFSALSRPSSQVHLPAAGGDVFAAAREIVKLLNREQPDCSCKNTQLGQQICRCTRCTRRRLPANFEETIRDQGVVRPVSLLGIAGLRPGHKPVLVSFVQVPCAASSSDACSLPPGSRVQSLDTTLPCCGMTYWGMPSQGLRSLPHVECIMVSDKNGNRHFIEAAIHVSTAHSGQPSAYYLSTGLCRLVQTHL